MPSASLWCTYFIKKHELFSFCIAWHFKMCDNFWKWSRLIFGIYIYNISTYKKNQNKRKNNQTKENWTKQMKEENRMERPLLAQPTMEAAWGELYVCLAARKTLTLPGQCALLIKTQLITWFRSTCYLVLIKKIASIIQSFGSK